MRRAALLTALLTALMIGAAPHARADTPAALYLDGAKRALEAGLDASADGTLWIADTDLRQALGIAVKRLIPRPPDLRSGRAQPRRERTAWILCGPSRCATYRGRVEGTQTVPRFDLRVAVRAVGYTLRTEGTSLHVTTTGAAKGRGGRARLGSRVGDLVLPDLEGKPHALRAARGKRLLLVTWSTWSTSRKDLEEWVSAWDALAGRELDLWLVALDVEGAERVRNYAPATTKAKLLVDRNADLLRRLSVKDAGHWFLIDELGLVRAGHRELTEADRVWIDLHTKEALLDASSPTPAPQRAVPLEILRERAAAEPTNVEARLALAERLEASAPAQARAEIEALVKLTPRSVPFAFRLARMHLDGGDASSALRVLDEARRRMPRMWVLRKQYWALEEPNRFYTGEIDLAWQTKRRKEEQAWLDPRRRR